MTGSAVAPVARADSSGRTLLLPPEEAYEKEESYEFSIARFSGLCVVWVSAFLD